MVNVKVTRCALVLFFLFGCDDSATGGRGSVPMEMGIQGDMGMVLPDLGNQREDTSMTPDPDMSGPSVPEPAYVEMALNPRRAIYTRSEGPVVEYTVYDRIGRVIPGADVRLDVRPAENATIGPDGRLLFLLEGAGAVRGCATPDICGRTSFYVDDGPPLLEITSPARGAVITGEPVITVEGRTDAGGGVRVFVNDLPVETDNDGKFETSFRASFGLNRIDVIADDGVRRPATRSVREVLWAPRVIPANDIAVDLEDVAILRMYQRIIDAEEAPEPPDADGIQRVPDLAGTVEALLQRSDLYRLLDNPQIANDENLQMRIDGIETGNPDVTILITDSGFEIFLRLDGLTLTTSGQLDFEGEQIRLDGSVALTVAGFASADFVINDDGIPGLVVGDVGLAVERLTGEFNDSTAQAIVDTVGSILRSVLNGAANELIRDLVAEEVPDFIELGIDDILEPMREINLNVQADEVFPPVNLSLAFTARRPQFARRDRLELVLSGAVRQEAGVQPPHPSPGIPDFPIDAQPIWPPSTGATIALRLSLVNAVAESVWHQGAFRIDLTPIIPDVLPQISTIQLDARLPPVVVPGLPGAPHLLELQFGEIDVFVRNPQNPEPDHYVMSLRAGLNLTLAAGHIEADVDDRPDIRFEILAAGGEIPPLAPELFETLVQGQIGPQLAAALGDVLTLDLDRISFEGDAFEPLNADIETIRIAPSFPSPPRVQNGWLVIGATAVAEIE